MELRLDLHIHSERSPDGRMTLREIAARAKAAGLDGVAVCDHDRTLDEVPEFPDLLLIPGVEVSTEHGHLLGLFVREPVETRVFALAAEQIHAQGGLAVLAHPFERSRDAGRIEPIAGLFARRETWRGLNPSERTLWLMRGLARRHEDWTFCGASAAVAHGLPVTWDLLTHIFVSVPQGTRGRSSPGIARRHLNNAVNHARQHIRLCSQGNNRRMRARLNQSNSAVLQLACGIGLGMNVADFLEL